MSARRGKRLRVLLLNWSLANRGGSEAAIRDIALGLRALDHAPMVYAPALGGIAREIEAAGIPVVDDLARLGDRPDIIHAQHYYTTGEALIHFPGTPAVHMCHGWLPALERPPRFAQIRRYIAVSDGTRDNIVNREGIDPARAAVLLNTIDPKRILPRPVALPARAARALMFLSRAHAGILPVLRAACAARGIGLETLGHEQDDAWPERRLVQYDLVFATGRSAMEALASGCAVVTVDGNGLGDFVTPDNLERFRRYNFGLFSLVAAVTEASLGAAIDRYDARAAADAATRFRAAANFDAYLETLIGHYRWAMADHAAHPPSAAQIRLDTQRFLRTALPLRLGAEQVPEARAAGCDDVDAAVNAALGVMRASTSWRITAPLRWGGGLKEASASFLKKRSKKLF